MPRDPIGGNQRRHNLASAGIVAVAVLLTLLVLIPARTTRLLIGRPGDTRAVAGMSLPSTYEGRQGRWTRGDGRLAFPDSPLPAVARLTLSTLPERVPDAIEVVVNGTQRQRFTLIQRQQTFEVPIAPRRGLRPTPTTIAVRSTTTLRGAVPQGVFVEEATLTTGGWPPNLGWDRFIAPRLVILFMAIAGALAMALFGAHRADSREPRRRLEPALFGVAALTLTVACAAFFRPVLFANFTAIFGILLLPLAAGLIETRAPQRFAAVATQWMAPLWALAAIIAIIALLPEAFLHGRVFSQADMLYDALPWRAHLPAGFQPVVDRPPLGDIPMLVYPFLSFTASRWWSGHFPIWTASIAAGQPFLATYQSALLSPFTWLVMVMPLTYSTVAMAAMRLLVGGAGMFLFLRRLGLAPWAAAFGGISYLLNPFSVVALEHPFANVLPWLPWLGVAAEAAVSGRAWGIAGLAIATALTLTGGHPHGGVFIVAFGGAYAMLRAINTTPGRGRALVSVVAGLALGAMLAAVQMLPFVEYLSLSRAATQRGAYELNPFIAPVSTLITAFVPNFLGHPNAGNFAGPTNYLEQQIYPGIMTWLLAPLGVIVGWRRWQTWFFVAATVVVMLMMYGAPGVLQLVSMVPLLKAASLPRLAIIAIASLTVLAAYGVDALVRDRALQQGSAAWRLAAVPILTTVFLIVMIASVFASRRPWLDAHALLDFVTHWIGVAFALLAAGCLVVVARLRVLLRGTPAALAIVMIASADLLLFGRGFHPTLPPEQVFPPMPEIERIRQDHDLYRVLGMGNALLPNSAMVYDLQDVRGTDGLSVARYADLLDVVLTYTPFLHTANSIAHAPLLDLLNVKYVLAPADAAPPDGWTTVFRDESVGSAVWQNPRVFPRAWLVDSYVILEGNAARRALRDAKVDGHRVAILEQEPAADERPAASADAASVGAARIVSYADERVVIETDATDRRLLVLTDVWYPGWTVRVDDRPATLHRANFAFRAVSVPAGKHRVEFVYRPASFFWGAVLGGAAGLALVALMLGDYFRLI